VDTQNDVHPPPGPPDPTDRPGPPAKPRPGPAWWIALLAVLTAIGVLVTLMVPLLSGGPQPTDPALRGSPAPAAGPARELTTADVDAWLEGFLPTALATGDIAGAAVVVVRDGAVVTQRGFGHADVERDIPVDPERTLFRPGSVSKLVTWTAVMQLVEQGRLDLDADVTTYLDFAIPARDDGPVTLRTIMTHTAGFEEQIKDLLGTTATEVPRYDEILRRWVPERIFPAGTTPAYSNWATGLAGYVVERVSGEPFDDYVRTHIFEPLGMRDSTFAQPLPPELAGQMSHGYLLASGDRVPFEIIGVGPAGSMSASAADMGRFMLAHLQDGELDGQRILRPETAAQMHDTALDVVPPLNRMRLGFFESNVNGREVIGHGGDTNAFHSALHLFTAEQTGLYVVVNSNGRDGASGALRLALFEEFADRYFPGPPPTATRVDPAVAAEHAEMMAGTWITSRRSESTFLSALGLVGQTVLGVGPDGGLSAPVYPGLAGQQRRWVEVEPFVWQDPDSKQRLAAVVEDGEVVRFSFDLASPFMVYERAPWYRSAALLLPLLYGALVVLVLTVLMWPAGALVRRRYGATLALSDRGLLGYRLSRLTALLMLVVLAGWAVTVITMLGTLQTNATVDPLLVTLQVLSVVAFGGGLVVLVGKRGARLGGPAALGNPPVERRAGAGRRGGAVDRGGVPPGGGRHAVLIGHRSRASPCVITRGPRRGGVLLAGATAGPRHVRAVRRVCEDDRGSPGGRTSAPARRARTPDLPRPARAPAGSPPRRCPARRCPGLLQLHAATLAERSSPGAGCARVDLRSGPSEPRNRSYAVRRRPDPAARAAPALPGGSGPPVPLAPVR
jgi:CubicO group peptidase (beta-lactamase class C family)